MSDIPLALSDDAAREMLDHMNFFYGVSFDEASGFYKSSRQAARLRPDVFNSVRISHDITTEDHYPTNKADAQSIHLGWPALSSLPIRPWNTTETPSKPGNWVSRRMVIHRYTVALRAKDLKPVEAFTEDIKDALARPTPAEQAQELNEVFAVWGEMIPTIAVIGASLAATGTLTSGQNLTGDAATFRPPDRGPAIMQMIDRSLDITGSFKERLEARIQGGYPEIFKSGFDEWLSNTTNIDNSSTWEVVKVNRAIRITDLLPYSLQEKIQNLYSSLPSPGRTPQPKDIKRIDLWCNASTVQDVSIVHVDGTVSGPYSYGKGKPPTDSYALAAGEFVTEVFLWATPHNPVTITSIQFAKDTAEVSRVYGAQNGSVDPLVLSGGGKALLEFSGRFTGAANTKPEAIWNSGVVADRYRRTGNVTHTGAHLFDSKTFNDYEYLGDPRTARISAIRYREGATPIAGFQASDNEELQSYYRDGRVVEQETPVRGTDAGTIVTWRLADDERITKVKFRRDKVGVRLLEFHTTKGNIKRFGQDMGDAPLYELAPADKSMVLYYFLGKSAGVLNLLSFAWGEPPLAI